MVSEALSPAAALAVAAAAAAVCCLAVLPGPHPVWHIRSRKEAAAFWRQHYAHLGAAATNRDEQQEHLKPDVTSKAPAT